MSIHNVLSWPILTLLLFSRIIKPILDTGQVGAVALHLINTPSGQVGVTPCKSEGIEPFTLVNYLPGQVDDASSHLINAPSGQAGVTP